MKSLITPGEVVLHSGVKVPFNPCDFRTAFNIEYYEFRKCLGEAFRDDLIKKLVDYSSAQPYNKDTTYAEDVTIKFSGVYYTTNKADVTSLPTVKADWDLAPKFSEEKCEDLFCMFLAPYLALSILARRIPYIISQITDEGVLEYNGREYKSSDEGSISRLQKAIYSDRAIVYDNLNSFLTKEPQKSDTLFANYSSNLKTTGCGCTQKTKCKLHQGSVGRYRFA